MATDVHEIDPINDARWAALAEKHPRASVFHSPNWLRALAASYGYEPVAITTCPPGTDLTNGLIFCRVRSWLTGRRLISLPFSDHCEPLVDHSDDLDKILLYLQREVDQAGWKRLEIRPLSVRPSRNTNLKTSSTYRFHRVDLTPTLDEILERCHKHSVQRKIRRAEREGLRYEEGRSVDLLDKFYGLMMMTRRRHGLPPQPRRWFQDLIANCGTALKIRVASKDGVPIASILTLSHNKSMVYKYGCSDAAHNNMGGMVFLLWNAIKDAKQAGCEQLDLGRSDNDNGGLITFKKHWGSIETGLTYWSYPHREGVVLNQHDNSFVGRLFSAMPNAVLEQAGRRLYKHFG